MSKLPELRKEIDLIDADLVRLLNRRAAAVLEVKKAKAEDKMDIYSPARERQILDRVTELVKDGPFPQAPLERIFVNIISATRSLIGDLYVCYLGPECSLAFEAAQRQFGAEVEYLPALSMEEVFTKLERGDVHYGVVTARTGSSGLVTKTFELLMQSNLQIIAEVEVPERLALFSKGTAVTQLKKVFGDSYFLSRAEAWLKANVTGAELIVDGSYAHALELCKKDETVALVAPESSAPRHGIPALARGVEIELGMDSRFVVLGHKGPPPTGRDKTSLLCSIEDRAGALRDILRPFSERAITLLKIESRPMRNRAWEYVFFIDAVGHYSEPGMAEAIQELSELSAYLKVLGSYPMVCHS